MRAMRRPEALLLLVVATCLAAAGCSRLTFVKPKLERDLGELATLELGLDEGQARAGGRQQHQAEQHDHRERQAPPTLRHR